MTLGVMSRSALCLHRQKAWLWGCRAVSTLTPLESAFNSRPKLDLRIYRSDVGLFQIPQLTDSSGFYLLLENAKLEADELVAEATSHTRKRKLVQVFDQLSDCLCRVADMADFVRVAHPNGIYSNAAEDVCVSISGIVEKMNTNVAIHQSLNDVIQNGDRVKTDAIDERVAELFMFDFEQSGIHLPERQREEFVSLNKSIHMVGNYFTQGTQKPVVIDSDILPDNVSRLFGAEGNTITIPGLCSDHHSPLVREAAYKIYLHPDKHQTELLDMLLTSRDRLAKLVGFQSYADRTLRGTLGGSPHNVQEFLETLAHEIRCRSDDDFKILHLIKTKNSGLDETIRPWDVSYYSGIARHQICDVHSQELAPYFSLGTCMEGLSELMQRLFGVTLENVEPESGELWSPDVHKLAVRHEADGLLGHIYCDFFERAGKPVTDCHFTIRGGRVSEDGSYQNPAVVLMLNFPAPRAHIPSMLSPGMVENLFHEFGHAMHSMLGRTRYQHVTGTRCSTDFAEVPSILMEYFVNDPRVIGTFARHWQTGEKLSEAKINKLCAAKRMFSASETQLQVFYSLLDQALHGPHPLPRSAIGMAEEFQNKYYNLPYVSGTAWHIRFGHFVGYGAKYYSYLMSRAVAASIWHRFFKDDPFNRQNGQRYCDKMLVHGGGCEPAQLVEDMLGETPTAQKLVQSLIADLEE